MNLPNLGISKCRLFSLAVFLISAAVRHSRLPKFVRHGLLFRASRCGKPKVAAEAEPLITFQDFQKESAPSRF